MMLEMFEGDLVLNFKPAEPESGCFQNSVLLPSVASVSVVLLKRSPKRGGSDSLT